MSSIRIPAAIGILIIFNLYQAYCSPTNGEIKFESTSALVYDVLDRVANHSWEWGAQAETILESRYPQYSVYSKTPNIPLSSDTSEPPHQLLSFLDRILLKHVPGTLPIVDGAGAAGDPASLGVATLVAANTVGKGGKHPPAYYRKFADDQLEWLLYHVPKTKHGAISQRDKELQFWSDNLFMAPPFIAYYGAQTSNVTLLEIAYNQAKQYRTILQNDTSRLLHHIVNGSFEDRGLWTTGNGWAAAGMMRIFATFINLRDENLRKITEPWRENLGKWVAKLVKSAYLFQYPDSSLLPNYLASTNQSHNYGECSGTAILAAAGYRLATLAPDRAKDLPLEKMNKATVAILTRYTNSITGAVAPVVDPGDWEAIFPLNGSKPEPGYVSPEGQAFTLFLFEAWKGYNRAKITDPPPT